MPPEGPVAPGVIVEPEGCSAIDAPAGRPAPRPTRLRRVLRRTAYVKGGLLLVLVLAVAAAYGRLFFAGPLDLADYNATVASALARQLGPGWTVSLNGTALELQGADPAVRISGLEIRNPAGLGIVRAPDAVVSLNPLPLLVGRFAPRAIELRDLQLRARVAPDGRLSLASAADGPDAASPPAPAEAGTPPDLPTAGAVPGPSAVAQAVASLLDPVLAPTGIVGSLDSARVTNARLTLVGANGRERVGFSRVDAAFTHDGGETRSVRADLTGPHGAWRLGGSVRAEGGERRADIVASDVPLDDVMLLSGLSALPAGSDVKLSGTVAVAQADGVLTRLEGRFTSSAGQVARDGQTPVRLDALGGRARWDEAGRKLLLEDMDVKSGATAVRLGGALVPGPERSWQLTLSGRDAVFAGVTPADPPVPVAAIAGTVTFAETGILVDGVTLKGDGVDVTVTGTSLPGDDGTGVHAVITATRTNVRRLFSLWPDVVNPELRHYLTANMRDGVLDKLEIRTDLDAPNLKAATSGKPIDDNALDLRFALSDASLTVIEGLPALRRLTVTGRATGTSTILAAPRGGIDMPDGRQLNFSDGTYAQRDEHKPGSVAQINFRIDGGADALASFLASPVFKDFGNFNMDPTTLKGRVDMKVSLPLVVNNIPRASELPLAVTGTLSDIAAERVFGRDRLDGGQFTVGYANGALALHGDGRIGGSPAVIDLKQPRGAPLDAQVALTLDDAGRTRRGLPAGPALSGPVAVKVTTAIGPKNPVRMEVDLGRASIEGLLPGWSKPAGRPGRMTFVLPTGDGSEVRDIAVDAGPVQIKGSAAFGNDGVLDRADLPVLRLSQGDDLKAQVERSAGLYRVTLRGNVADARPVLRWMTGAGGGGGGTPRDAKGKDAPDVDVDMAVNILTGHNDEALTGATAKISVRNRDVKALQLRGQFRGAGLEAQIASRRDGAPLLTVTTADAGATLRFVDLYKRMVGGAMTVQTTTGDVQAGTVAIDDFTVRNEPALKRIAAQTIQGGNGQEDRAGGGVRIEGDQVQFTKLTGEFRRTASRVEYKDVVVWGAQAGFNLAGYVDYGRDRTDVAGTFVPAYGLNNAFSQLPIIGVILGGGRNEGLFAVDFRVSGLTSSPTFSVNPLSVVAPGILRKLFGWALPGGVEETTGATRPRPAGPAPRRPEP